MKSSHFGRTKKIEEMDELDRIKKPYKRGGFLIVGFLMGVVGGAIIHNLYIGIGIGIAIGVSIDESIVNKERRKGD